MEKVTMKAPMDASKEITIYNVPRTKTIKDIDGVDRTIPDGYDTYSQTDIDRMRKLVEDADKCI